MTYYEKLIDMIVADLQVYSTEEIDEDVIIENLYTDVWEVIKTDQDAINVMKEMGWTRNWQKLVDDPEAWDDDVDSLIDVMGFAMENYFKYDGIDEVMKRLQ